MNGEIEVSQQRITSQTQEVEKVTGNYISREKFLDYFQLSEKEVKGIDVEGYIKTYQITENSISEFKDRITTITTIQKELAFYQSVQEGKVTPTKYDYRDKRNAGELTKEDFEQIKTIVYRYGGGTDEYAVILDFAEGTYQFGNHIIEDASNMTGILKKGSISEEVKQSILIEVKSSDILNWPLTYEKPSGLDSALDYVTWAIFFELENGQIKCYSGYGVDSGRPSDFDTVADAIKRVFQ